MQSSFSFKKLLGLGFGVLAILAFSFSVMAQYDDPNSDRIPWANIKNPPPRLISPDAVITVGDYDNFNLGTDFAEVHISVNPMNPANFSAAWNDLSYGNSSRYTINGYDWFLSNPSWGATMNGDPVTGFDSVGNCFQDNMYGSVLGTRLAKSTNGGANWISIINFNTGNDKNWIACDQTNGPYKNYIYGVMTPGNIKRSTDGGATMTQVYSASNTYPGMMVCVGPNMNTNTSGGCVYVVTNTGSTAYSYNYNFYCSTDGGTNWSLKSSQAFPGYVGTWTGSRHAINGQVRTRPYPMITADNSFGPYRGRLYLVYAKNTPNVSGNKPDIYLHYSTDQGASWSAPVIVNDDPSSGSNNQFFPSTWCDKETGKLYITWSDTRNCPTADSSEIYATYSTNGGASFAANQKISNQKMRIYCPTCGGGGSPVYQGDYNYIGSNKKCAILAWTDFRSGTFGSYVGYFPDFGMRLFPTSDSIRSTGGDVTIQMQVPSVKLYTDTVVVTSVITPTPAAGTLTITYPSTNKLSTFPGNVPVRIQAAGGVTAGTYTLTVTAKGPNGTPVHVRTATIYVGSAVSGVGNNVEILNKYELYQNYPNPFNPSTKIEYNLPKISKVKLTVYDVVGKEVTAVNYGIQQAGKQSVEFNAGSLSSGVYFYKIEAGSFTDTKKMFLLK
ncbi:MAG: T9SS type A sorting domain-containing protein [Ignavibacteriae bacterium]|nr:T9SS type A sorting domain-containing protein [Ignavibacteriota bacterium]